MDVHHNTVHRLLKSKGLIHNYGNHRRPRYQETKHMYLKNTKTIGYLQMDVKYITPELSGLPWTCYEYAIIDIQRCGDFKWFEHGLCNISIVRYCSSLTI